MREAGGTVTSLDGARHRIETRTLIASNQECWSELQGTLAAAGVVGLDPSVEEAEAAEAVRAVEEAAAAAASEAEAAAAAEAATAAEVATALATAKVAEEAAAGVAAEVAAEAAAKVAAEAVAEAAAGAAAGAAVRPRRQAGAEGTVAAVCSGEPRWPKRLRDRECTHPVG